MIGTIAVSPTCYARDISFSWTANTEEIDGYKLYILAGSSGGITKTNYSEIVPLDQITSYTHQGLDDNQAYHFALTAFRNIDNLESDFSAEIMLLPVDAPPADDVPPVDETPPTDTVPPADTDFNQLETIGYSNQDREGTVTIEDKGATLAFTGNRWIKTVQYYDITQDTVIEFDFMSTIEGEIHGIGFDEDDELTNDKRIFQFFGTQLWTSAIQTDQRYLQSDLGNWVHFVIPVGQYYTGSNLNLVFVNDHDNAPANGTGWFSNVKVHEGAVAPPSVPSTPPPAEVPPPAPPAPSPTGLIIDNGDSETSFIGDWKASGGKDYYGTNSVYNKSSGGGTYRYETSLNGQYEISLWWTEWASRCTNVPVEIYDGSTLIDTLTVDQHENGGQWNIQGNYGFTGTGSVVIVSQGSACSTNADAVRIISSSSPAPPPPAEIIVDNGDSETSSTGDWLTSGGKDYYGTNSVYNKSSSGGTYRYETSLNGRYDLSLWWTEWPSRCTNVPVQIYDGSTLIDTLTVNQQANGGKWNLQGRYTFTGTGGIVIVSQGSACSTNADAVRLSEAP